MDKETEAAFAGIMVVLGELTQTMDRRLDAVDARFNALDTRLAAMATKTEMDERFNGMMARMNDGFERVSLNQHVLQVNDDNLTQRVTRLEEDVRKLRGGGI
jgi:hypothetical protein